MWLSCDQPCELGVRFCRHHDQILSKIFQLSHHLDDHIHFMQKHNITNMCHTHTHTHTGTTSLSRQLLRPSFTASRTTSPLPSALSSLRSTLSSTTWSPSASTPPSLLSWTTRLESTRLSWVRQLHHHYVIAYPNPAPTSNNLWSSCIKFCSPFIIS